MSFPRQVLAALFWATCFTTACGQTKDTTPLPEPLITPTRVSIPTSTFPAQGTVPNITPPVTATPVVCDPSAGDYCILPGHFILQHPIAPPGDRVDRTYAYASTAGGTREAHHGVEFPNPTGTPVLAAAAGRVFFAGDDSAIPFSPWMNFYGNLVVLVHTMNGQNFFTLYAHLSSMDVTIGQSVLAGEKIGEVGATGVAIGSHLHFEVRMDAQDYNSTLNPELWVEPSSGTSVLSLRLVNKHGDFQSAPLSLQYFPDPNGSFTQAWEPDIYPAHMLNDNSWENAAIGGLPPGRYRITFLWNGIWQERWLELQDSRCTYVELVVGP